MRRVGPILDYSRCLDCGLHRHRCICASLEVHPTRVRIRFVQHIQELLKPTNSARLACRILSSAEIVAWDRVAPPKLEPEAILLYPLEGSLPLQPEELTESVSVVIPDGTWAQASRIANVLGHGRVRARTLPLGNHSLWTVRQCKDPERISSAQAAAVVLELAGEAQAAASVMKALVEMDRAILSMRGIVREPASDKVFPTREW